MPGKLLDHAVRQAEGVPLHLEDLEGEEVTITAVRFTTGDHGPYCIMSILREGGECVEIQTSGMLVLDALEHAEQAEAFPCTASFAKSGRTWVIA